MARLSHTDDTGRARMVDVGEKKIQRRIARAIGRIRMAPATCALIRANQVQKGDVLTVAQVAGIAAAKRTGDLIPLCHPLSLDVVHVSCALHEDAVEVTSEVHATDRTGVEMEALTAVSVALLTIYDMCKAADKAMLIEDVHLIEKVKLDVEPC
jgi:cyclic pyranopterin monophosphate synthase